MKSSGRGARSGLGTGAMLFVAAQFPPSIAGAVLLLLAVVRLALSRGRPIRLRSGIQDLAGELNIKKLLAITAAFTFLVAVQHLALSNDLKPLTAAHLLLYLLVALGRRHSGPSWPPLRLVRIVTLLNAALLLSFFVPPLREIFWYENLDQVRFRSYYFEPSIAAMMYVLHILVVWFQPKRSRDTTLLIVLNLACLAVTYSGSGLLLLGTIVVSQFSWRNAMRAMRPLLLLAPLGVWWILSPTGTAAINEFIVSRVEGILALDFDNSVHLRAVAPFLFVSALLESGVNGWLGAGIGGIESFIADREASLWFLTDFKGDLVTAINNGYVVLIALVGLPLAFLLMLWLAVHLWRSPAPRSLKIYFVLYPFLSGFVIHPLVWLLVTMLGSSARRRLAEPRLAGASCVSPS